MPTEKQLQTTTAREQLACLCAQMADRQRRLYLGRFEAIYEESIGLLAALIEQVFERLERIEQGLGAYER
jgi:hypothetical protein